VYRPQPKRKRVDLSVNPLWTRYIQQQGVNGSQFIPTMCRTTNSVAVVSPPVSSLSNAIDRAKYNGEFLTRIISTKTRSQAVARIADPTYCLADYLVISDCC